MSYDWEPPPATAIDHKAKEAIAMQNEPKQDDNKPETPDVKDVEPGSDADETPTPEVGKTPANPNKRADP